MMSLIESDLYTVFEFPVLILTHFVNIGHLFVLK